MATADVRIIGSWDDSDEGPAQGTVYFQRHDTIQSYATGMTGNQVERTTLDSSGSIDTTVVGADPDDPNPLAKAYRVIERIVGTRAAVVYDIEVTADSGTIDLSTVARLEAPPTAIPLYASLAALAAETADRIAADADLQEQIANGVGYNPAIPDNTLAILDPDTAEAALAAAMQSVGMPPELAASYAEELTPIFTGSYDSTQPLSDKLAIGNAAGLLTLVAAAFAGQSLNINELSGDLAAEAAIRQLDDENIRDNINALDSRTTATQLQLEGIGDDVTQLQTDLGAETTAREAADAALAGDLATEADDRATADGALAQDIADEANTRATADSALDSRLDTAEATLLTKADLVGGKVPSSQLPAMPVVDRKVVANQAARLALTTAEPGDIAVQLDTGTIYLLVDSDASINGNWQELEPGTRITSVNGQTSGAVVLGPADVGADPSGTAATAAAAAQAFAIQRGNHTGTQAQSTVANLTTDLAGKVPTTRQVAGKPLSADVTLVKGDVGLGNADNTSDASKAATEATAVRTLTNKRVVPRVLAIASSATPAIDVDAYDRVNITALATAVTSMTSGLTGTPTPFQSLVMRIKDDGTTRAITWGASFVNRGATMPTATTAGKVHMVGFFWNSSTSTWDCHAATVEA